MSGRRAIIASVAAMKSASRVVVHEQVAGLRRVVEDGLGDDLAVVGAVAVGVGPREAVGRVERQRLDRPGGGQLLQRLQRRARFWPKPRSSTAIVRPAPAAGDAPEHVGAAALQALAERPSSPKAVVARARPRPRQARQRVGAGRSATTWSRRPSRRCTRSPPFARPGATWAASPAPRRPSATRARRGGGGPAASAAPSPAAAAAAAARRLTGPAHRDACGRRRCRPCPPRWPQPAPGADGAGARRRPAATSSRGVGPLSDDPHLRGSYRRRGAHAHDPARRPGPTRSRRRGRRRVERAPSPRRRRGSGPGGPRSRAPATSAAAQVGRGPPGGPAAEPPLAQQHRGARDVRRRGRGARRARPLRVGGDVGGADEVRLRRRRRPPWDEYGSSRRPRPLHRPHASGRRRRRRAWGCCRRAPRAAPKPTVSEKRSSVCRRRPRPGAPPPGRRPPSAVSGVVTALTGPAGRAALHLDHAARARPGARPPRSRPTPGRRSSRG